MRLVAHVSTQHGLGSFDTDTQASQLPKDIVGELA
jgi:hypothetical protein